MVLVLTPVDQPGQATKTVVEGHPPLPGSPSFANSVHLPHCTRLKREMRPSRNRESERANQDGRFGVYERADREKMREREREWLRDRRGEIAGKER